MNVWYSGKLPLYVSDLISVANTSTSNKFAWNGAPDATGYEVYQGTSPSDPHKKKINRGGYKKIHILQTPISPQALCTNTW